MTKSKADKKNVTKPSASSRRGFLKYVIAGAAVTGAVAAVGYSALYKPRVQPEKMSATIGILGSVTEAPVLVANDTGLFDKYGIATSIVSFSSLGDQTSAFMSNNVNAVAQSFGTIFSLSSGHFYGHLLHNLGWVGAFGGKNYRSAVAIVRSDLADTVRSVTDLRGLTVASLDSSSFDEVAASIVLRRAGLDPGKDVKWVGLSHASMVDALAAKEIAATFNMELPFWLEVVNKGYGKVLIDSRYIPNGMTYTAAIGVPTLPMSALWGNDSFLKSNQGACSGITKAMAEAVNFLQKNPEQSASIVSKYAKLSTDLVLQSLSEILYFSQPSGFIGWQTYMAPMINAMISNGVVGTNVKSEYFLNTPCFKP